MNRLHLWLLALTLAIPATAAANPATAPANLIRTSTIRSSAPSAPTTLDLPRVLVSLAIVVAAIWLLRELARRFLNLPAASNSRAIRVLSRTPVSPRQHVLAIQTGRRILILADNGQQLSTLSEITDPQEICLFDPTIDLTPPTERIGNEQPPDDIGLSPTRLEIRGLLEKVRGLSRQFK